MPNLTPCTACGRHHKVAEQACPHCGVATVHPGMGMMRNLKVGALMAFTAATTAACYGAPSPVMPHASSPKPLPTATTTPSASPDAGATNAAKP